MQENIIQIDYDFQTADTGNEFLQELIIAFILYQCGIIKDII